MNYIRLLLQAPHRHSHHSGQTANLAAGERAMALDRLIQFRTLYGTDIVSLGHAIFPKSNFPRTQK